MWKSISPATNDWFMVAMSPTSLAPLKTRLRGVGEFRDLVLSMLA